MMIEKVWRSGIIPYFVNECGTISMLFMIPSDTKYSGDSYQLGKGRIEGGETPEDAALREGNEELGLRVDNILNLFKTGIFLGRTHVFAANVMEVDEFDPFAHETTSVAWLTLDEFRICGRDLHVDLVEVTHEMIMECENVE